MRSRCKPECNTHQETKETCCAVIISIVRSTGHTRKQCQQWLLLFTKMCVTHAHCVWYEGWVSWTVARTAIVSTSHGGLQHGIEVIIIRDRLAVGDHCGNRTQRMTTSAVTSARTFATLGEWVEKGGR